MPKQVTQIDSLSDFSLMRFEPGDIVLLNRYTQQSYKFYELNQQINLLPDVTHPYLERPILYKNGVLYPKGDSNLAIELDTRIRAYQPIPFSIQEICNTFAPIIQCIQFLHQNGIVHGTLSTESILFFENGDILLKDWIFKSKEPSLYQKDAYQLTKSSDLSALGLIISQAVCLEKKQLIQSLQIQEIVAKMLDKYQPSLCYALIILLKGMYKRLPNILSLMSNDQKIIKDQEIINIFQKGKALKEKRQLQAIKKKQYELSLRKKEQNTQRQVKQQKIQKKQPITDSNLSNISANNSLQGSPTKKFNITSKKFKLQDSQNKKSFNEDVKKRQIEKITKIIERSNAFVNQLMARKNNEKKILQGGKTNTQATIPAHNNSMYDSFNGMENTTKKLHVKQSPKITSPKINSPSKRLRSIPKKK